MPESHVMSTKEPGQGCDTCNKSGLSLLLLRASPIAKDAKLAPLGAEAVKSADAMVEGLVPARKPTESRMVLRLLRAGFVHVYIPSPPPGMKNWLVYRITEGADLIADSNPVFAQMPQPPACSRNGHNAAGMKLMHLPQAHKIGSIWIAYSANLWSDKLKSRNAANPKAMQQVSLQICGRNAFTPTADALKSQVLECAITSVRAKGAEASATQVDQDFPFVSMAGEVQSLADNLQRAAACHPKTKGLEMAVVLRDPVGFATELNAIRLRRQGLVSEYTLQPDNRHPAEVNKMIQLLRGNVIADADERSMDAIAPLTYKASYEEAKAVPGKIPEGTKWRPLDTQERVILLEKASKLPMVAAAMLKSKIADSTMGRMIYPDWEQRAERWAKAASEEEWAKMLPYYDESKRKTWQDGYEERMRQLVLLPLKHEEADWAAALDDVAFYDYFGIHFDEQDANDPRDVARRGCCAGAVYVQEARLAYMPEPQTESGVAVFEAQLDADISSAKAVMLRAVVANQSSLVTILEASAQASDDSKRDKTYDFMKGLVGELKGVATADGKKALTAAQAARFAWMSNATLGFSFGLVGTLAAVASNGMALALESKDPKKAFVDGKALARLNKAQSMALIHRASEEALAAVLQRRAPNVPVFLMANFDVDTAIQIKQARGEKLSLKAARRLSKAGRVQMGIITDVATIKTLAEANVDPKLATRELASNASVVQLQEEAINLKGSAIKAAAAGATLVVPVNKFMDIYEAHQARVSQAPSLLTQWLQSAARGGANVVNSTGSQALRSGVISLEGRLAIGSMIVQGMGVLKGLQSHAAADDVDKVIDARLAIADGAAGFLGGMAELAGAAWEARVALIAGQAAVEASAGVSMLRGMGYGLGFAGNVVNAWMSFRAADKLEQQGNRELARLMFRSGMLFSWGGVPLALLALHSLAEAAAKRGMGSLGTRAIITKVGETLGKRWFLSVPGWGWALTVVAVGHTVYVIQHTPTAMQNWLKLSRFGKPEKESDRRKSWAEEEAALKQIQNDLMTTEERRERTQRVVEASTRA
jgi:hypothetical protein